MGRCLDQRRLWGSGSGRNISTFFMMLLVAGAALGSQEPGHHRTWYSRTRDASPKFVDAMEFQRETPNESDFSGRKTHKLHHPSKLEPNTWLPQERDAATAAKQRPLNHHIPASGLHTMPQLRQSLPGAYRRRLELSPGEKGYDLNSEHTIRIGPPPRSHLFERRNQIFHYNPSNERVPYFQPNSRYQEHARSLPSFKSRGHDYVNLGDGFLPSNISPSSMVGSFYDDHNIVRKRTNEKFRNSDANHLKNTDDLSSHRFKNSYVLSLFNKKDVNFSSYKLKKNSSSKVDSSARGRMAAENDEQDQIFYAPHSAHQADQDPLYSEENFLAARFRGRSLLSVDAESLEDREPGATHRAVRSAGGSNDAATSGGGNGSRNCSSGHDKEPKVRLVTLRWDEVGVYFTITAFVMFAGLGKLGFHQMHWLSRYVPESCLLIVLGVIMGLIVFFTNLDSSGECGNVSFPTFDSASFFLVLLPPIILESAYSLHDRSFLDNLGSVLVFAIFGTLLNIFIIGPSLFGLALCGAMGNFNLTLTESLVFSSLISAVDPVAVLSIFQELGVHKGLYFLVFGESLLNDGVTVVVYNMVSVFMELSVVKVTDYLLAVVGFFVVTLCGTAIGVFFGIITALVTRTTTNVRVVEPLALLGFAYLAYLGAEIFHFSGIISLIACGLVQAQYAFQNISDKSYTCVKYFTKMASATSETIIFMFLGMVLVSKDHVWHTGFVLWTLFLCFVVRVIVTLVLSAMVNYYRVRRIGMSEQLILAYGGLRGAVAFSLVSMLDPSIGLKEHFVTATLVVILFTVFVQGITMGPLVKWLDVAKRSSGPRILFEEVHVSVVDHMMAGIEEVLGEHGDFYLREQLRVYNEKYLKRWFVRPTCEAPLKRLFEKIAITEHYAHLYGPAELIQQHDMDVYSSKTKLVDDPPSNGSSNRASVQILTTEDDDTGKVEQLKLEQVSPKAELKHRKNSVASILGLPDGGRRPSAMSSMRDLSARQLHEDARLLRRAISSNPYNQLHYTHNRNLVNEDHQELQSHLQRRHTTARRLTRLASRSSIRHPSAVPADSPQPRPLPPPSTLTMHHPNYWFSEGSTKNRKDPPTFGSLDQEARKYPAPDDAVQLRTRLDARPPNESSWNRQPHLHPRPRPGRMVSLPGEINPLTEDELATLPGGDEVLQQVQGVQAILDSARRRSLWRRNMMQRRNRTLSGGDRSARNSVYSDSHIHSVPEEPTDGNEKNPLTHHTAIDICSTDSADDPLGKLVADLPKSIDEDSAYSPDPLSGYSSDYSTTGYSTDSTLPLTASLRRPTFEPIPEHQASPDDPLLPGASSGRRGGVDPSKRC